MRQLKDGANSVSNRNRPKLDGQSGQTLIELMIGVSIGLVVALGVAGVMTFAVEQFQILVEKNEAEENLLWAAYHTRLNLMQAVRIDVQCNAGSTGPRGSGARWGCQTPADGVVTAFDNAKLAAGIGQIIDYTSPSAIGVGAAPTPIPIATFYGERGLATTGSKLRVTGMFFTPPADSPPGAANNGYPPSGSLSFAFDTDGDGMVSPTNPTLKYDHISSFSIQVNTPVSPAPPAPTDYSHRAQEATITIGVRNFSKTGKRNWYYSKTWPAGAKIIPYRDVTMEVKVGFRNNELGSYQLGGAGRIERLHGNLYYFLNSYPIQ